MKTETIKKKIEDIPRKIAFDIEKNIRETGRGPKHGREYKRRKRVHIASAPGEAPAKDTGNLLNNANLWVLKEGHDYFIVLTAEYAHILEFGGKNTAPRPFIKPSIDKTLNKYKK